MSLREPTDGEPVEPAVAIDPISRQAIEWFLDEIAERCAHIKTHLPDRAFGTVMVELCDVAEKVNLAYHVAEHLREDVGRNN